MRSGHAAKCYPAHCRVGRRTAPRKSWRPELQPGLGARLRGTSGRGHIGEPPKPHTPWHHARLGGARGRPTLARLNRRRIRHAVFGMLAMIAAEHATPPDGTTRRPNPLVSPRPCPKPWIAWCCYGRGGWGVGGQPERPKMLGMLCGEVGGCVGWWERMGACVGGLAGGCGELCVGRRVRRGACGEAGEGRGGASR